MGVFGAARGTKTWSDKPNDNYVQKQTQPNNISATEQGKLGEENVGDVLNKVADPNYVDPAKKMRGAGSDKMDKDAFMKLMLAQMKHQDPTNPLKSHEMAAQLAQFTSVEQLTNINSGIEALRASSKPTESFQALNFIGKAVSGDSAKIVRMKGDKEHDFTFNLPDDASKVEIKIRNAQGDVLRKVELKDLKKGQNNFVWNGQDEKGMVQSSGEYSVVVEATAKGGKNKLNVKTDFDGVITGVSYTAEGPVLLVGNQSVRLSDVKKIVDPSLKKNDQKAAGPVQPDLKNQPVAAKNESKGEVKADVNGEVKPEKTASTSPVTAKATAAAAAENKGAGDPTPTPLQAMLDNVALTGEMKNKLANELK